MRIIAIPEGGDADQEGAFRSRPESRCGTLALTWGELTASRMRIVPARGSPMPQLRPAAYSFAAIALIAASASAFAGDADWQKSYPVSAKPSLALSTGDASTEVRSCGQCRAISVRVQWNGRNPSEYIISEFQTGDHVNFEIKEKVHLHMFVGVHHQPQGMIETPAALDLEGRTTDGSLRVSGLQGGIQLHTS